MKKQNLYKKNEKINLVKMCENFIIRKKQDKVINFMRIPGWEKDNMFMEIYFEKLPTDIQLYIFKEIKHWKKPSVQKFNNFETVLYIKFYNNLKNMNSKHYKNLLDYSVSVMKITSYHEWDYINQKWIYNCDYKNFLKKIDENNLYKLGTNVF